MNRRSIIKSLIGLFVAPAVIPPQSHPALTGIRGFVRESPGYVYAPWIPMIKDFTETEMEERLLTFQGTPSPVNQNFYGRVTVYQDSCLVQ